MMSRSSLELPADALRRYVGLGPIGCCAVVLSMAAIGGGIGLIFPKYEANALLDTPGASIAEMKRVMPGYASDGALGGFIAATGETESGASRRLMIQAESIEFWEKVASPILPISRKDTKEIGDIKDGLTTSLIGLELKAAARDPETAGEMVRLLGDFFANALLRERIRTWIVGGLGETRTRQKTLRADVIATQLNIDSTQRRIADLKALIARYPDASRADGRQVVSVAEGGDRFLPLPSQLVAAESNISQLRESILRTERQIRQLDRLAGYFLGAEAAFNEQLLSRKLIPQLLVVSDRTFSGENADAEWLRESSLRTQASISGFAVVQDSFGIRNGARVGPAASRGVVRLALLGGAFALILLGAVAFLRATLRTQQPEVQPEVELFPVSAVRPEVKRVA